MKRKQKFITKKEVLRQRDLTSYPFMNTALVDMEGEKWEEISFFDGCFLVSNYGRIKSLPRLIEPINSIQTSYYTKETIISQHLTGIYNNYTQEYTYRLSVALRYERKRYPFSVAKLVYEYFVDDTVFEIDQKIIVYKDKDNLNNRAENLAISDRTTAIYEAFKNDTRARKPAKPERIYNQVGVHQYDLQGNLIHKYSSVSEVAETFQTQCCHLRNVLTNQVKHYKGFVFRYETDKYEGEYADFSPSKSKKVSQYTIEGIFIKTYESLQQAFSETGIRESEISVCALHKQKFGNGFVWRYEGDTYEGEYTRRSLKVAVHQYEKNGKFLQEFDTISAAAKSINLDASALHACLTGKVYTCGGYIWRYTDQPYHGEYKSYQRGIPVAQLDQTGKVLATFITIRAAGKATGVPHNNIQKNVSGDSHSSGGYFWRAATPEEIEKLDTYVAPPRLAENPRKIEVCQYTKEGEKVATYGSIAEASKATGIGKQTIRLYINNPNHVSGKFIWRKKSDIYHGELNDIFGKSEAKIITQYDMKGNKVAVYPSTQVPPLSVFLSVAVV